MFARVYSARNYNAFSVFVRRVSANGYIGNILSEMAFAYASRSKARGAEFLGFGKQIFIKKHKTPLCAPFRMKIKLSAEDFSVLYVSFLLSVTFVIAESNVFRIG